MQAQKDGLDALADRGEVQPALGFVAASRSHHVRPELGERERELAAGVALVADDRLAAPQSLRQDRERDFALGAIGGHQRRRPRRPVEGADEVQAHPPEVG